MIKPTIGRVVWFRARGTNDADQPNAAIVCKVHSDTSVNLVVFDGDGNTTARKNVDLFQGDGQPRPVSDFCEWMPFQIGQAKAQSENKS